MAGKNFYLTTTLPYVNADPHIGFALEIVQADIVARYRRLMGDDVFFNTGTDEHGVKIYRKALDEDKDPQIYVNEYAAKFRRLKQLLGLYPDLYFIRTTDPHHRVAAQEFWKRCAEAGDIEKKIYKTKYCIGCELEKTDSELIDSRCPIHPNLEIEFREEENYFFKFSKYQKPLLELYANRPDFVIPDFRFNEIKKFVGAGLEDFSISRLKEKMPWGIPVPGDEDHIMFVWFDALINYVSTLGWPEDRPKFEQFWGTVENPNALQMAGKDNLRQQAAMWQAMLMSAGLPPTKQILIHGFITSGGQKMSKSLGNVIDPVVIIEEYGTDALRYFLARHVSPFEDSDFTMERFKEAYNSDLANGLGNLVARILQMSSRYLTTTPKIPDLKDLNEIQKFVTTFEFSQAMVHLWFRMKYLDGLIQEQRTFEVVKTNRIAGKKQLKYLLEQLAEIAVLLEPFMPDTSKKITEAIIANKKPENLFPRKE
ncbi:hypothetical protein A2852_00805 [Candidatus Adlerbacteria bacterium RIFCSPHIGHO2_01_FULL_54_23]|uniref:methionine--tRNA ligase n=3 Tax=Candidatus Adleribacteriota TaxID=1752736 RepID=A0A1F4XZU2_9BACT|nr:MAG: Methionine-tRNA ligase [Candidatus Adlerbacteria bacterium GW2011_GWA1_54_10]KKW36306.1 MAG: Methionine-tRNA ligase [Candidatus Adlerbacteria bacterium GW2011_GWA2_54_12]KKW37836.1 MAG: Methionine-tRNA ligase [Candidatus Adlerbacteria bacterium GW2011_GWB1_54_7]OGC78867.1 MAG: hypothetical protein A2852_00805 [Candidatus Adlerbacteria bacterium RIFCSPHIGHO2_01_FULL_54_23]OGC87245.1 MAG: hypothetical protein A3B33_02730 [Candidatus Adlerbacteria bacterium RIFCSPLOWO2_01_FULL_54_16]